jgi:putative SbcD/Mre11-related phosphoesterase
LLTLDDQSPWRLTPEGAAVHPGEATAVIADVHLGYEWARGAGGDQLPAHSLRETLAKLHRLLARVLVRRLIVAGDLVETPRRCARTAGDVRQLIAWLQARRIEPVFLKGNHDPRQSPPLPDSANLEGWTILHGDRPLPEDACVFGHHHPALKANGVVAPCFLAGEKTLVLPAFSPNAAGLDVCTEPLPKPLRREALTCVAALDGEILNFGPLADLRRARARVLA